MSNFLLASAEASSVRLWDTTFATSNAASQPNNAKLDVNSFTFTPSQSRVERNRPLNIDTLTWSQDNLAISGPGGVVYIHNMKGECIEIVRHGKPTENLGEIRSIRFAARNNTPTRLLIFGGSKKIVYIWDRETKKLAELSTGHKSGITCVALNVDESCIASSSETGEICIYNRQLRTSSTLESPTTQPINALEYSQFQIGLLAAAGDDGTVLLWNTKSSATPYKTFKDAHMAPVKGLAFSPLNKHLLSSAGLDQRIVLYDAEKKAIVKVITTNSMISSLAFRSDGVTMAAGTTDGSIMIYDLRSATKPMLVFPAHEPHAVKCLSFQRPDRKSQSSTAASTALKSKKGITTKPSASSSTSSIPPPQNNKPSSRPPLVPMEENLPLSKPGKPARTASQEKIQENTVTPATAPGSPPRSAIPREKDYMDMFSPVHPPATSAISSVFSTKPSDDQQTTGVQTANNARRNITKDQGLRKNLLSATMKPASSAKSTISVPDDHDDNSAPTLNEKPVTSDPLFETFSPLRPSTTASTRYPISRPTISPMIPLTNVSNKPNTHSLLPTDNSNPTVSPNTNTKSSSPPSTDTSRISTPSHSVSKPSETLPFKSERKTLPDVTEDNNVTRMSTKETSSVKPKNDTAAKTLARVLADETLKRVPMEGLANDIIKKLGSTAISTTNQTPPVRTTEREIESGSSQTKHGDDVVAMSHDDGTTTFQHKVLESVVDECLTGFRQALRNDIRDMHLELLRQFHIQRNEMEGLLQKYCDRTAEAEELERLREENRLLRMNAEY